MNNKMLIYSCLASTAIVWMCLSGGSPSRAQTPPAAAPGLSPDLQEVVTLSHQKIGDDVITNYIQSTGKSYRLSANDIIYLKDQGVSSTVLTALLQTASPSANAAPTPPPTAPTYPPLAPTPAPALALPSTPAPSVAYAPGAPQPPPPSPVDATAPAPAPPPDANFDYFQQQLAPYGTWVNVPGYGDCWYPAQAIAADPDWRPYYDMGHWVETDNGLFWASDYTWGDIPFHYGRWIRQPGYGWLWVPDYTWGPAWVCWRQADADGYIGWAPLPAGAIFIGGVWQFGGRPVDVATFDFGLGANFFVFVDFDHFCDPVFRMRGHEWAYHVPLNRVRQFYRRSVVHNDFRRDEHGRFVNDGIGRQRMGQLTHNRIEQAHFEERNPVGNRDGLENQRAAGIRDQNTQRAEERGEQRGAASSASKVFRPSTQTQRFGGERQGQSQRQNGERASH